ncbi:hypothetical protein NUW54_g1806 [Trametes sanguinea]|uniref:Uncharacterized protein n=1 Tax=Trametes sanguinea TaxID=158606 RepID=A0ACC1Q5C3_9APHY|nr:hypothetical protein NUW54_g1806 [Trametes sanguinea]
MCKANFSKGMDSLAPDMFIHWDIPALHVTNLSDTLFKQVKTHVHFIQQLLASQTDHGLIRTQTFATQAEAVGLPLGEVARRAEEDPLAEEPVEGGPKTAEAPPEETALATFKSTIDISEELDVTQHEQLLQVLIKNQTAFLLDGQLGTIKNSTCSIPLWPGAKEVSLLPFPGSPAKREVMDMPMDKWIELGVIEPSVSPWGAPAFIVYRNVAEEGVTLVPAKCHFAYRSLMLLEQKVSRPGLSTHYEKVKAITELAPPRNVSELHTFLRMMIYFSAYIPFYTWIAAPLFNLLKKEREWDWQEVHQEAFDLCKQVLVQAPNERSRQAGDLDVPSPGPWADYFEDTIVHLKHVIAYWSRILKAAEQNYSPTEREALALTEGLIKFQPHIVHRTGRIHSNVNPISRLHRHVPYQDGPAPLDQPSLMLGKQINNPLKNAFKELGPCFEERLLKVATKFAHILCEDDESTMMTINMSHLMNPYSSNSEECIAYTAAASSALIIGIAPQELDDWKTAYLKDTHFSMILGPSNVTM